MMNFLGLDLSLTSTGFYLIRGDEGKKDECCEICTKPDDFCDDIGRSDHIAQAIIDRIKNESITFIALEDYFTGKQP